jgi:hypothetical protein
MPGTATAATQGVPGVFPHIPRPTVRTANGFPEAAERSCSLPSANHPQNKNNAKKKAEITKKKL